MIANEKRGLSQATIEEALRRMGQYAGEDGVKLEISLYGGGAMVVAFNSRFSTNDLDVIVMPREKGFDYADRVAEEMGLPKKWLNDEVFQYLSPLKEEKRKLAELSERTGVIVSVPTAKYLLAMKALACRDPLPGYAGDVEDLVFLIRKLEVDSVDEIQEVVDQFYPDDIFDEVRREKLSRIIRQAREGNA